ncbi:3-oxoacyl-[acyl-carrier-protein] synthase III C-terminal domain-containing protein [Anabaena cylindrica UHCC 0172]|uniref:3-oxoacyl-[acyl-carrier-protein] synthase III C-terminal domain-containing protein n=1 Tax=Anabaena cylindrica TaxID=1165 RepID=UPI002B21E864|nr:3-oxoacyl-[acyl-carrier-protein] synthase III C-terminal domain-containing protein [Anabaena cylindrica]MEA5552718.1 3-oxoacyl-[acyl-carrier-protein] synthase III C-terminal domain-containing protein [Anabaena cylindrica UHCC 0172]
MNNYPVGIRSLAVSFPSIIRTNDYWRHKFPNLFAKEKLRKTRIVPAIESTSDNNGIDIWSQEVAPYLSDAFRGNVERRVLGEDESSLKLECHAAKDAIASAKLSHNEIDLLIVASLFSEHIGPGHASYLAHQLELQCPAWNLESTCSSALVALENAHALVQVGTYRNILVVVSQIGSNTVDEEDTLSWSMGDGAGAFVVGLLKPHQGILGSKIVHTAETCGAYVHELVTDAQKQPQILTRTGTNANTLAETAVDFVRQCCHAAVAAAGVTLDQIDFFAFNTPTAWYASVCTRALGINPERTINLYPRYANIGPVLPIANLYHAVHADKIRENDLVLVYTKGAAATAAATVMRWGDVALGQVPADPISVTWEDEIVKPAKISNLSTAQNNFYREKILAAATNSQQQMLEMYLLESMSSLLQIPLEKLDKKQFFAILLDSLMAIMLKNKIESDLQLQVSLNQFLGEQNINGLATELLNQLTLSKLITKAEIAAEEREILSL